LPMMFSRAKTIMPATLSRLYACHKLARAA
jgi:hypothetical protein